MRSEFEIEDHRTTVPTKQEIEDHKTTVPTKQEIEGHRTTFQPKQDTHIRILIFTLSKTKKTTRRAFVLEMYFA